MGSLVWGPLVWSGGPVCSNGGALETGGVEVLGFCMGSFGLGCCVVRHRADMLEAARRLTSSREILPWMIPSEAPKALKASECSELLDPMRASCRIFAQH